MRWDNLRLDDQLAADQDTAGETLFPAERRDVALPLIERGAVARTFDTPGFRGMTFYEVQAKSVVNRVPEASRMPFRWTINPYRGCQHSGSVALPVVTLRRLTRGGSGDEGVRSRRGRTSVV
jgi:hypothetical protein